MAESEVFILMICPKTKNNRSGRAGTLQQCKTLVKRWVIKLGFGYLVGVIGELESMQFLMSLQDKQLKKMQYEGGE